MKKRNLNSLKLNKQSIATFSDQLKGGQANSGLEVSCRPALCIVTKEGNICEEIKFPPLDAAPNNHNPYPYDVYPSDVAANAPADSPAG